MSCEKPVDQDADLLITGDAATAGQCVVDACETVLDIALAIVADLAHSVSQSRNGLRPWIVVAGHLLVAGFEEVCAGTALAGIDRD